MAEAWFTMMDLTISEDEGDVDQVLNFVDDVNDDVTTIFPQIDYKKLIEDNERAEGDMADLS